MKAWKKIILFLLIFIPLYFYVALIFTPKSPNDKGGKFFYAGKSYKNELENTVEVLAIGNSDLYSALVPLEIYNDYGYTIYNCGISKSTPNSGFKILRDVNRKQNIKLLILETDFMFENRSSGDKAFLLGDMSFLISPFEYHARWKELHLRDFYTIPRADENFDPMRGFKYSKDINPYYNHDYMNQPKKNDKISHKNLQYMYKIREYCKSKNIELVFVEFPSATSWNMKKHDIVQKYCDKYDISFIDYNLKMEELGIDITHDFRDKGNHLNIYGAKKVTKDLGIYLKDTTILTDFRTNENNIKWERSLSIYKEILKNDHISD